MCRKRDELRRGLGGANILSDREESQTLRGPHTLRGSGEVQVSVQLDQFRVGSDVLTARLCPGAASGSVAHMLLF